MNCDKPMCEEDAVVRVDIPARVILLVGHGQAYGGEISTRFCISHMRDFAIYVADRLEAAEKVNDAEERK
jgi:hypothetical protein